MSKSRVEDHVNGAKPPVDAKKTDLVERRRDATDLDEVSIRLWNALGELAQREDEFLSAITALVQERKKNHLLGQSDLRTRFQMPPAPRIEIRSDGTRELVWSEPVEQKKD
jgi:hypothetical protein